MKKKEVFRLILLSLLSFIFTPNLQAQTLIELSVNAPDSYTAKLKLFKGKEMVLVDSCKGNDAGIYQFSLPKNAEQGLYRITIGKSNSLDLIVANESAIRFKTQIFAFEDSLKVIESEENKVYQSYLKLKRDTEQQFWLFESLIKYYKPSDLFYQTLINEQYSIKVKFYKEVEDLIKDKKQTFAYNYINLETKPLVLFEGDRCAANFKMADSWWNNVNLEDNRLLHTPDLLSKFWDYLELALCEDRYTMEEQDSILVQFISKVLEGFISDSIQAKFVRSLSMGFSQSDYFGVVNYLMAKYPDYTTEIADDPDLKARLLIEQNLMPGKRAYNFKIKPVEGKRLKLSDIKAKYTLLVFWSVWCPHCIDAMPKIDEVYNEFKADGFEVVAVNVDSETKPFTDFVKQYNLNWINMQVTSHSTDPITIRYNVDETPKMFLIDRDLNIVSRPQSSEQVQVALNKLLK